MRAVGVEIDQAPPATTLWHFLHSQMPTQERFTVFFPQKVHVYLEITGQTRKHIRSMLTDLDFLHNLTQRRTIACSVLSANSDLLCSLTLFTGKSISHQRRTSHSLAKLPIFHHSNWHTRPFPTIWLFLDYLRIEELRDECSNRGLIRFSVCNFSLRNRTPTTVDDSLKQSTKARYVVRKTDRTSFKWQVSEELIPT